jgi:hypothetical protein
VLEQGLEPDEPDEHEPGPELEQELALPPQRERAVLDDLANETRRNSEPEPEPFPRWRQREPLVLLASSPPRTQDLLAETRI